MPSTREESPSPADRTGGRLLEDADFRFSLWSTPGARPVAKGRAAPRAPRPWRLEEIRPGPTKELLEKRKTIDELAPDDIQYDVAQKGVDMRIGLDIASLSQKQFVRRIVLVAGDADFVPAAKFARREGIDVILDPMWRDISDDLLEHIDGLRSLCPKPKSHGGSE